MPIDAEQAFLTRVRQARPIGLNASGEADYGGLLDRVRDTLAARSAAEQFEVDVGLWYGYLVHGGGTGWKQQMVGRLFNVLMYGGLLVNRGEQGWVTWASQSIPICSAISHTARVLIQFPASEADGFLEWLWGRAPEGRAAATHGVEAESLDKRRIKGFPAVEKYLKENKTGNTCNHYGVNIALGGEGNIHPVSGKGIRENGKHGHLYIARTRQAIKDHEAILVGVEQSSPIDRQEGVQGSMGKVKTMLSRNPMKWVPDQYGGGHGVGGHSRFSATGGDDFAYGDEASNLDDYGPARGHYYDGMFVQLTRASIVHLKKMAPDFQPKFVSYYGFAPSGSSR